MACFAFGFSSISLRLTGLQMQALGINVNAHFRDVDQYATWSQRRRHQEHQSKTNPTTIDLR